MFLPEANDVKNEEKSFNSLSSSISFPEFLANGGNADLSSFAAIELYKQAMPFFNAINTRAKHFSMIPIRLFNTKTNEFIDDHPVLELLKSPSGDVSQIEFLQSLASYYDITGNLYIVANGRVNRPPLDLITLSPTIVSFGAVSRQWGLMNIPSSISVSNNTVSLDQFLDNDVKGKVRFYNKSADKELWRINEFNAGQSIGVFTGTSLAQPLWYELQQYIAGNRTNLSMLKRGTRLSMAWVNTGKEELTPTQYERLQEQAQLYSGDVNAGKTPILDGMDVKTIQQTNRDMEFKDLQAAMLSRISNLYDIPLAMLLDTSMTENNLQVANVQLYDNAVLPLASRIYDELTRFLLPRYPDSENLEFRFNENDIPALRARIIETANLQKKVGVNSTNEIREVLGDEPLDEGGDDVLIPTNLIPIGQVGESQAVLPVSEETRSAFLDLYLTLTKAVDEKGERKYSESDIIDLSLKKGLLIDGD